MTRALLLLILATALTAADRPDDAVARIMADTAGGLRRERLVELGRRLVAAGTLGQLPQIERTLLAEPGLSPNQHLAVLQFAAARQDWLRVDAGIPALRAQLANLATTSLPEVEEGIDRLNAELARARDAGLVPPDWVRPDGLERQFPRATCIAVRAEAGSGSGDVRAGVRAAALLRLSQILHAADPGVLTGLSVTMARYQRLYGASASDPLLAEAVVQVWTAGTPAQAVASIDRAVLRRQLRPRIDQNRVEAGQAAGAAEAAATAQRPDAAAAATARVRQAVAAGTSAAAILARVDQTGLDPDVVHAFADALARADRVDQARHAGPPPASLDAMAALLTADLLEAALAHPPVLIQSVTDQAQAASPAGRVVLGRVESSLVAGGVRVQRPLGLDARPAAPGGSLLLGTCLPAGDGARIDLSLVDASDGLVLGTAQVTVSPAILAAIGAPIAAPGPPADGIIAAGDFALEVTTSRGKDAPVFTAGERMQVAVHVGRSCYLRMLYVLADGTRTRLTDTDLMITGDQVGRQITLPTDFVASPPYGRERLVAIASTAPMAPLATRRNDQGYEVVVDPIATTLAATRGLRDGQAAIAEAELVIVTVP
jgi:hypothetical protein